MRKNSKLWIAQSVLENNVQYLTQLRIDRIGDIFGLGEYFCVSFLDPYVNIVSS